MMWRQFTAYERSLILSSLDWVLSKRKRSVEMRNRIWSEYLSIHCPDAHNPEKRDLLNVREIIQGGDYVCESPRDRFVIAWALDLMSEGACFLNPTTPNKRLLNGESIASADDMLKLSSRLKQTLSRDEFFWITQAIDENYAAIVDEQNSNALANDFNAAKSALIDIVSHGSPIDLISPQEWFIIKQAIMFKAAHANAEDISEAHRLLGWIKTSEVIDLPMRIQQSNLIDNNHKESAWLRQLPGVQRRNVDGHTQYRRLVFHSDIDNSRLLNELSTNGALCVSYVNRHDYIQVELLSNEMSCAGESLLLSPCPETEHQLAVRFSGDLELLLSKLNTAAFGGVKLSHYQSANNSYHLAISKFVETQLDDLLNCLFEFESTALLLTRREGEVFHIRYGSSLESMCDLIVPSSKTDFVQMSFESAAEWNYLDAISLSEMSILCPNCGARTTRMALVVCDDSNKKMCRYRKMKSGWFSGCGHQWVDALDRDYAHKAINQFNKLPEPKAVSDNSG